MHLSRTTAARGQAKGFTLLEVMIVAGLVAILAAIALPSYQSYVKKSRAKAAAADLVAWSLVLENRFQKTLAYPVYTNSTTVAADPASRSDPAKTDFGAWMPSQSAFFVYSLQSTASTYTLTGQGSGSLSGCTLTLTQANARNAASSCTVLGSW